MTSKSQPTLDLTRMLLTGSIVRCFIPAFGKDKFFLTLHHGVKQAKAGIFYLNSGNAFPNDFICKNADFPCLPANKTGDTIVACASVYFLTHSIILSQNPIVVGGIPKSTAQALYAHCMHNVNSYSASERAYVLALVQAMC